MGKYNLLKAGQTADNISPSQAALHQLISNNHANFQLNPSAILSLQQANTLQQHYSKAYNSYNQKSIVNSLYNNNNNSINVKNLNIASSTSNSYLCAQNEIKIGKSSVASSSMSPNSSSANSSTFSASPSPQSPDNQSGNIDHTNTITASNSSNSTNSTNINSSNSSTNNNICDNNNNSNINNNNSLESMDDSNNNDLNKVNFKHLHSFYTHFILYKYFF